MYAWLKRLQLQYKNYSVVNLNYPTEYTLTFTSIHFMYLMKFQRCAHHKPKKKQNRRIFNFMLTHFSSEESLI